MSFLLIQVDCVDVHQAIDGALWRRSIRAPPPRPLTVVDAALRDDLWIAGGVPILGFGAVVLERLPFASEQRRNGRILRRDLTRSEHQGSAEKSRSDEKSS